METIKTLQELFAEEYEVYTFLPDLVKDVPDLVKDLTEAQTMLKDLYRAFYLDENYPVEFNTDVTYSKISENGTFVVGTSLLEIVSDYNKAMGYSNEEVYPNIQSFIHRCLLAVGDTLTRTENVYKLNLENSSFFKVKPSNYATYRYLRGVQESEH